MITIAVDPGKVTGVAILLDDATTPFLCEVEGRIAAMEYLSKALLTYAEHDCEVVCERFIISTGTGKLSPQYDALAIIGALEFMCHVHVRDLFMQSPAEKAFGSNEKLKALGWYKASPGGHQNDAARHLLRHLVCTKKDTYLTEMCAAIL